jgi:para-nitrobenzyl esterase
VIRTVAGFREDASKTYGPLADAFLGVYAANDDSQAAHMSAAATRDRLLAWPTLKSARAQAQTGHFKVFYYYFAHHPPVPPEERFVENLGKDLGAYHGAELAYVFGNFVPPEWPWTETDRELARTISQYWVNFARNGDPNASGLPQWPAFDPKASSVLYIDKTITPGPIPNQEYIALWDTFAAKWRAQE